MGLTEAQDWLRRARGDSGWGYEPGLPTRLEPSMWAASVLGDDDLAWFEGSEPGWEWLLMPALLADIDAAASLRERATTYLMGNEGFAFPDAEHLDGTLQGWNWAENTFSWLEPTCFAMISLARLGRRDDARWKVGHALVADRVCDDGGWNYGNGGILDARLMSYVHSTAWAVMAMPPDDPLVPGAQDVLERALERPSTRALATSLLARVAAGLDPTPWAEALQARQRPDGQFGMGRVDRTALAAAALMAYETGTSVVTGVSQWEGSNPAAPSDPEPSDEQE